ncbi:transmembrane protein, putative [Medicago truncatula]|uniref:Transmembrane protein, putative n=1 Tax=Medicago truncatula TaxID=3880 RepID=G7L876_MEDTR|nr:transmembrane protein, putative [Medicago truncatula]
MTRSGLSMTKSMLIFVLPFGSLGKRTLVIQSSTERRSLRKLILRPFYRHVQNQELGILWNDSVASFSALRPDQQACLHFMQNESSPRLLVLFESMIYRRCKPAIIGSVLIVLKLVMYNFLNMFEA